MSLRISTVTGDVFIEDLGISLTHPTADYDLTEIFTAEDIKNSADLTAAIQAGSIIADDGTNVIHKDDYDPSEVMLQDIGIREDSRFVSHDELTAGYKTTYIYSSVFPLGINSTASVTRNIYAPSARLITWSLSPDDTIVISGNAAAGTYTVESVTDQQNFIVVESIVNSTGGDIEIFHPGGASKTGINPASLSWTTNTDLQSALEDLDGALNSQDEKVKVSANDATAGYLFEQIEAGTNVTVVEVNDGADEKVRISVTPNAGQFDVNRMVLDCDGSMIYIGNGDIVICDTALPGPVTETNCE